MAICIAHVLGLTEKQVQDFIGRNSGESWAKKKTLIQIEKYVGIWENRVERKEGDQEK